MANRRLPMRKIKEILRLYFQARLSARQIARSCLAAISHRWDLKRPPCLV